VGEDVSFTIGGENAKFLSALQQCRDAINSTSSTIKSSLAGLNSPLNDVSKHIEGIGGIVDGLKAKFSTAFAFTGIAAGLEIFEKVGEEISKLSERATKIATMSDVLGLTSTQFQTLQVAAEGTGVSIDVVSNAVEKLKELLGAARDGSGEAIDKLHQLGITNEQIHDPTFDINALLTDLRGRLNGAGTATEAMSALTKEFGNRAKEAAEAIKSYDGSLAGQQKAMEESNGLSEHQIQRLHEMGTWWKNLGTEIANTASKLAVWTADLGKTGPMYDRFVTPQQKQDAGTDTAVAGYFDALEKQAQFSAQVQREMLRMEMENVKAGVTAFKSGTAERLEALREYARLAAQYYGSDTVAEVVAANQAVQQAEQESAEKRETLSDQLEKLTARGAEETTKALSQTWSDQSKEAERQWNEQARAHEDYMKAVGKDQDKMNKELADAAAAQSKTWKTLGDSIKSGFGSSIDGLITHTKSWGDASRTVASSIAQAFSKAAATNIETMLQQALVGNTLRAQEIRQDAGAAAAGAYKAVVGIPYVGPFLAPAAAAVAYAGVLAFDSAEGGYDIPAFVNPLTQLHAREMVLPADIADTMRSLTRQSASGDGAPTLSGFQGAGSSGDTHNHNYGDVHIKGGDPMSALGTPQGRRALMDTISGAVRRGWRGR
jgi:hypothetical protein